MRLTMRAALATALLALPLAPAAARVFPTDMAERDDIPLHEFTCPLGGATWRQPTGYPHLPLDTFPDGSHLGDEWVDTQIPECPDNGLLLLPDIAASEANEARSEAGDPLLTYHSYTADELARLPALLASPEWQALAGQTRALKAFWLATWLGRPERDRIDLLQWAGWGTEGPEQRTLALTTMVEQMPGLIDRVVLPEGERAEYQRATLRYYVINALRELGRFDEALAMLEAVESATPGVAMAPDPDAIFGPADRAGPMRRALAVHDADRYAVDLLPNDMASRICGDSDTWGRYRGASTRARCAARAQAQADRRAEFEAVSGLLDDREALAPRCAALAAGDTGDDAILAEACRQVQYDVDWAAGEALFDRDPAAAFAMCESVPEEARDTAQVSACTSYAIYLPSAIADLLVADRAAYAAICDAATEVGSTSFGPACTQASSRISNAQARSLWADKRALRQLCRTTDWRDDQDFNGIDMACEALENDYDDPYWAEVDPTEGQPRTDPPHLAALPYARQHLADELARRQETATN